MPAANSKYANVILYTNVSDFFWQAHTTATLRITSVQNLKKNNYDTLQYPSATWPVFVDLPPEYNLMQCLDAAYTTVTKYIDFLSMHRDIFLQPRVYFFH